MVSHLLLNVAKGGLHPPHLLRDMILLQQECNSLPEHFTVFRLPKHPRNSWRSLSRSLDAPGRPWRNFNVTTWHVDVPIQTAA